MQLAYFLFVQDTTPVDVVDKLNLSPYCSSAAGKQGQASVYRLVAVTNHSGVMGNGHYIAQRRSCADERWYTCNDGRVVQHRAVEGPSEAAYMLFYKVADNESGLS